MEPKHKRRSFGLYEMALLKENPYTYEVRACQTSFTAEFKRIFWARYQAGEYIPGIFESLGYDPEVLGIARMYSLASNLRKCVAEGREFTSGYINRAKSHGRAEKKPAPDTQCHAARTDLSLHQWQLAKLSPNEFYRYLVSGVYPLLGKPPSDVKLDPI